MMRDSASLRTNGRACGSRPGCPQSIEDRTQAAVCLWRVQMAMSAMRSRLSTGGGGFDALCLKVLDDVR